MEVDNFAAFDICFFFLWVGDRESQPVKKASSPDSEKENNTPKRVTLKKTANYGMTTIIDTKSRPISPSSPALKIDDPALLTSLRDIGLGGGGGGRSGADGAGWSARFSFNRALNELFIPRSIDWLIDLSIVFGKIKFDCAPFMRFFPQFSQWNWNWSCWKWSWWAIIRRPGRGAVWRVRGTAGATCASRSTTAPPRRTSTRRSVRCSLASRTAARMPQRRPPPPSWLSMVMMVILKNPTPMVCDYSIVCMCMWVCCEVLLCVRLNAEIRCVCLLFNYSSLQPWLRTR